MKQMIFLGFMLISLAFLFNSCLDEKSTVTVPTHPEDWNDPQSNNFHGLTALTENISFDGCQSCHGDINDPANKGGESGVSCYSAGCHAFFPHPDGFNDGNSPAFHGKFIEETLRWDILSCRNCHGTDYAGEGYQEKNCLKCHTAPGGPEACNLCHGSRDNAAPPNDLMGNDDPASVTVGAHQIHLTGTTWTTRIAGKCENCHTKPDQYSAEGHIDDTPHAELNFHGLATGNALVTPSWTRESATCNNVYCHGGFEFRKADSRYPWAYTDDVMSGNKPILSWTDQSVNQTFCGSCHGLPPTGHIGAALDKCGTCHSSVVDENLNIINKYLHINGEIEVY